MNAQQVIQNTIEFISRVADIPSNTDFVFEGFNYGELVGIFNKLEILHDNEYTIDSCYNRVRYTHHLIMEYIKTGTYLVKLNTSIIVPKYGPFTFIKRPSGAVFCKERPEVNMGDFIASSHNLSIAKVKEIDPNAEEWEPHWYFDKRSSFEMMEPSYKGPIFFNREDLSQVEKFLRFNPRLKQVINYDKMFLVDNNYNYGVCSFDFFDSINEESMLPPTQEIIGLADIEDLIKDLTSSREEEIILPTDWLPLAYVIYNGMPVKYEFEVPERGSAHSTVTTGTAHILVQSNGCVTLANPKDVHSKYY